MDADISRRMYDANRGYSNGGNTVLDRLDSLHASTARVPLALSVQRFEPLDAAKLHARVLFHVAGQISAANLEGAIAENFVNKVRYLNNSVHRPDPSQERLVAAFVGLNAPAMPYSDFEAASANSGLRCLSGNVFSDASDKIWRKVDDMLVQDTEDDLSTVLAQRMSDSIVTAAASIPTGETFGTGDGVLWYDPHTETRRTGIAVAGTQNPRVAGAVFAFDCSGSHEDQRKRHEICAVDPRTVLIATEADNMVGEVAMPLLPPPEMPVGTNKLPSSLPSGSLPPSGYAMPTPFPTATPVIAPNNGMNGNDALERQAVQHLIQDREPLTRDNMIERHLAYMSVLYSQRGEYFNRLSALLNGAFRNSMALN